VVAGGFVCANGEWGVIEAGGLRDTTVPRNRWMCNARRAWQTAAAHQQPARSKHLLVWMSYEEDEDAGCVSADFPAARRAMELSATPLDLPRTRLCSARWRAGTRWFVRLQTCELWQQPRMRDCPHVGTIQCSWCRRRKRCMWPHHAL